MNIKYERLLENSEINDSKKDYSIVESEKRRLEALEQRNRAERALEQQKKRVRELEYQLSEIKKKLKKEKEKTRVAIEYKRKTEKKLVAIKQKIERMENWTSLRLGRAILNCRSVNGLIRFPYELWKLYKKSTTKNRNFTNTCIENNTYSISSGIYTPKGQRQDSDNPILNNDQQIWLEKILQEASAIPNSNGCRFYKKLDLRVGIICDEFFYDSIRDAANFIYVTPENWRKKIEDGLDAFLYVSAWRGVHEEWKGATSLYALQKRYYAFKYTDKYKEENISFCHLGTLQDDIIELLETCKSKNIPTIFYSKEDPPNFWMFLELAKHCDYVFTSAQECVDIYKEYCGHDRVGAVSFGINPQIHNPIGMHGVDKKNDVIFSGSWMKKYPERCAEISKLFDGVTASGHALHIIDRNYPHNRNYFYPRPYLSYVSPAQPHDILQKIHKMCDWAININTVKNSQTMFANRSFELQANGVLMISNYSVGMNSILPNIFIATDRRDINGILNSFTEEEKYERQISGVRSVMTGHTCYDRIGAFLQCAGYSTEQPVRKVLVLADTLSEHVCECFSRQTYEHKQLYAVNDVDSSILNDFDIIAWFAEDAEYEEFYLEDMTNAFKYTACDYVTKDAWYEGKTFHKGVEHNYISRIGSKYRTIFWREAFSHEELVAMQDNTERKNGYSIDHFNYNSRMMTKSAVNRNYLLSVIVPIYNNGRHLYGKCFSSLRRSSMFKEMEIIFVDDGSTDAYTLKIQHWLARHYDNIRLFAFVDGGSGSASRARNKGVELATAPYIAFLDPDNEAVCDGYAQLYKDAVAHGYDLELGNMYKSGSITTLADYYKIIMDSCGDVTLPCKNFHQKTRFMSPSIQAMVIQRDLLINNGLQQVVGAAGQDTLLAWQLVHCSKKMRVQNLPIHIYYAQTADSVTNIVRAGYFKKLLLLQKDKANWLVHSGNMDTFMASRYDYYTVHWIMKKLSQVSNDDIIECIDIVKKIHDIYAKYYNNTSIEINRFVKLYNQKRYADIISDIKMDLHTTIIPSMKDFFAIRTKNSRFNIRHGQKEKILTLYNDTKYAAEDEYAWAIFDNTLSSNKVYSTKYSREQTFTFDCSRLEPGVYFVRCFLKHQNDKIAENVAAIQIDNNGRLRVE